MSRLPSVTRVRPTLGRVAGVAIAALLGLTACELPSPSAKSTNKTKPTTALVPFGNNESDAPPITDPFAVGSVPDSGAPSTTAEQVEAAATEPEVTVPPETDPSQNPVCIAVKQVVALNEKFDTTLSKALGGVASVRALVRAMQSLPVEALRNAYDDLSAELTLARRRRLAAVRDFVVITGSRLTSVRSVDDLSNVIGQLEADPSARRAAANTKSLSPYFQGKCGVALTLIGDHASKGG